MTGNEPPEDPSEAPTGYYDYSGEDQGHPKRSAAWYRRPIISLIVGLFVAIVLGIAIYLLAERTQGTGGTTQTPTSPTTSTGLPSTSALPTTTEPLAPPETTATTSAPTSTDSSTTASTSPSSSVDGGHHRHHHHDGGTP